MGHSEGNTVSYKELSTPGNSVARTRIQSSKEPSYTGSLSFGLSTKAVSGSTGSLGQQRHSLGAASPSAQSSMHQPPPSPSFSGHYSDQIVHNLAERDHPLAQAPPNVDLRLTQSSGLNKGPNNPFSLDSLSMPHQSAHLSDSQKLLPQNLQTSSTTTTNLHPRHHIPFPQWLHPESKQSEPSEQTWKPPLPPTMGNSSADQSNPLGADASGQLSTSSLLAAVMNSGILGKSSITGSLPKLSLQDAGAMTSQAGVQPPLPSGPPPTHFTSSGPKFSPASLLNLPTHEKTEVSTVIPERKVELPPLPPGPPPSSLVGSASSQTSNVMTAASNPMSSLLNSLVSKGLISTSKTESTAIAPPQMPLPAQKPAIATTTSIPVSSVPVSSAVPLSSTLDELSFSTPAAQISSVLPQPTTEEIKNLIGFEFKSDIIRGSHPAVISELLDNLPYQCSICGLRLKCQERFDRHLEWHASKNPKLKSSSKPSRDWYVDSIEWVSGKAGMQSGVGSTGPLECSRKAVESIEEMAPADESLCLCVLCGELFEDFYSQERDEWMFKGAVYMAIPSRDCETGNSSDGAAQGPIVHAKCISESSVHDLGLADNIKMEMDA
ncbi:unnamed protein product [Ilex paraguariensis]|uniref:C2H2-type domain-containing protein n=1 Tax=Ilex paraguariensis TaxID=185542 RepID=A0ABC8TFP3_9AQUA